ncbi:MAG: tRNA (adenosine(37)-N6)-threonylcarbamoyltransferase complex dimerization subunit type 1 TsaB [Gammaproteobacteria bacterium]|nr:tRNA (adenosine(37)-N6)-threonylcarbamoyltransferase complex dimerization subunit type 1 TsaB [Gammaproteobacteria bacterium]
MGRSHSQKILPTIESVLSEAGIGRRELDGIVYGQGPGSFTGVRITVGIVQGLAFGLDIPVVGVSTLACLAQQAYRETGATNIVVALAARAEEVYFGSYVVDSGMVRLQGVEAVLDAADAPSQSFEECLGVGSGWALRSKLETALGARATDVTVECWPRARALLELGRDGFDRGIAVPGEKARPEYLREHVAKPGRPG